MKITYLKLENFAGIYAGIGRKEIEINFKNNKNSIIVLSGKNGSGKSVLLSCLTPFRETNDDRKDIILEGEKGYKEIHITHKKNKYVIKHFYGSNSSQNKSFISKNGEELNENGGIKTFNNIVKDELRVTHDYFKVGRLGNNVRNFIDLKTAERKKYINQFIPSIDDYLSAYEKAKNVFSDENKKLKSIKGKLEKFDNFDSIKSNKNQLEKEINRIEKYKLSLIEKISGVNYKKIFINKEIESKLKDFYNEDYVKYLLDREDNNFIIMKLKEDLKDKKNNLKESEELISLFKIKYPDLADMNSEKIKTEILLNKEKERLLLDKNKDIKNSLDDKILKISKLKNDLTDYKNKIESFVSEDKTLYEKSKEETEGLLTDSIINLSKIDFPLKEENIYTKIKSQKNYESIILKLSNDFKNYIIEPFSELMSNINDKNLSNLIDSYDCNIDEFEGYVNKHSILLDDRKKKLESAINQLDKIIFKISNNDDLISILNNRPSECTINNCSFISKSLEAKEEKEKLPNYEENKNNLESKLKLINNNIELNNNAKDLINGIKRIKRNLNNIIPAIIFNETDLLDDFDKRILIEKFSYLSNIHEIFLKFQKIYNYEKEIDNFNSIIDNCKVHLDNIEKDDRLFTELKTRLNCIKDEIQIENKENDSLSKEYNNNKLLIDDIKNDLNYINKVYEDILSKESCEKDISNLTEIIKHIEFKSEEFNVSLKEEKTLMDEEKEYEDNLKEYKNKLKKINKDFIIVESSLNELKEIEENYDVYKLVKDSLDPKIGIPLIFIDNYLKDISSRANELLQISSKEMFQIKFEITETDFFIMVYKNDGTYLKDIIEASQGEVSLTNISLSLSMIEKMMDEYNILYLDEVDATLSTQNRRLFLELVEKQIKELDIEQVFVISHNNEFYASNVDLILLKDNDVDKNDKDVMNNKNIIFDIED